MDSEEESENQLNKHGVAFKPIPGSWPKRDSQRVQKTISMRDWFMKQDEKENICNDTLNEARSLVENSFRDVQKISTEEVVVPELSIFQATVHNFGNMKHTARTYKTYDGSTPKALQLHNIIVLPNSSVEPKCKEVKVIDSNNDRQSVNGVVVPTNAPSLPRLRYFLHSETNNKVPDTLRLSNVPHIVDDASKIEALVSKLGKFYNEGIHGTNVGSGEYINDYMMWKLLEIINKEWNKDYRYVCGVIFEMFPNKYSFEQLTSENTLLALRRRFSQNSVEKKLMGGDRVKAVISLFCSKCMLFNCPSHGDVKELESLPPIPAQEPKPGKSPCSEHCFLDVQDYNDISLPTLENSMLMDFFQARVAAVDYDLCKLTKQLNMMCLSPKLECRQWSRLLKSFPNVQSTSEGNNQKAENNNISTSPFYSMKMTDSEKRRRRERYKIFSQSQKKRDLDIIDNSVSFEPCDHPGKSCQEDNCCCYNSSSVCNKYCRCDSDCPIKFCGCTCSPGQCTTPACQCFLANWECDPDTCLSCNCDVTHPLEPAADGIEKPFCRNMSLQLKVQKKVKVGVSAVAGNGLFLIGSAKPGELIGEYIGEIISNGETERRGAVYDAYGISYVFELNQNSSVDACKAGNLMRFANNDSVDPNCFGRVVVVNGEQRIGVYAKREIQDGEEIFFDYNYAEHHQSEFVRLSPTVKK